MRAPSRTLALLSAAFVVPLSACFAQPASPLVTPVPAQALLPSTPVERSLAEKETHSYTLALDTGQFVEAMVNQRGVDVIVRVFAPDGSRIAELDSPNGDQGDEPVAFEAKAAGAYRIEVSSVPDEGEASSGNYKIELKGVVPAQAYAERLAIRRAKRQAVVAQLKDRVWPIATVEAGKSFADLQPLRRVFKDVRIVGLGEETHGTREFFQFKHRMLEFLVKEMGFRVFAIEASYAGCQNINDYVMGLTDDGTKALDSQGFWTWNTEEVRAMLDWLRDYNKSVAADRRVKFVGFDIQNNASGKTRLLDYFRRVAPERVAELEKFFAVDEADLRKDVFGKNGEAVRRQLGQLGAQYNSLYTYLDLNAARLAAKSSAEEVEQMREYARVVAQYLMAYSDTGIVALRDQYMVDNFRRLVAREPAGARFVVWAHNAHISTGNEQTPFGHDLRATYGGAYYALGMSFNQGAFQARDIKEQDERKSLLTRFSVGPAREDSVDAYLAQTGAKMGLVDFRSRKSAELSEWLATPHPMRMVGSGFAADALIQSQSFPPVVLGNEFDGLFFIDTTTRARPNPSVKNVAPEK